MSRSRSLDVIIKLEMRYSQADSNPPLDLPKAWIVEVRDVQLLLTSFS